MATTKAKSKAEKKFKAPKGSHTFEPMTLNFAKMGGLVPFVLQHAYSREVLMVGFLNEEAWKKSCKSGILTMFRRGLGRVWTMGEDDGNFVKISRVKVDCDDDTVLFETVPEFPICGHGYLSCFYQELHGPGH